MPGRESSNHTGRFVVRLGPKALGRIAERARKTEPDLCSLHELAEAVNVRTLRSILKNYPAVKSHPVVRRRSVAQILEREASRKTDARISAWPRTSSPTHGIGMTRSMPIAFSWTS